MKEWRDDPDVAEATGAEPVTQYDSLEEWVDDWFVKVLWRRRQRPWCDQWYQHAEVRARLGAAWSAWEGAYSALVDGQMSAMATWFMTVGADVTRALAEPSSPLQGCDGGKTHDDDPPVKTSRYRTRTDDNGDPR